MRRQAFAKAKDTEEKSMTDTNQKQLGNNPSSQPTCNGWLRQPAQAAERKR